MKYFTEHAPPNVIDRPWIEVAKESVEMEAQKARGVELADASLLAPRHED